MTAHQVSSISFRSLIIKIETNQSINQSINRELAFITQQKAINNSIYCKFFLHGHSEKIYRPARIISPMK